MKKQTIYFNQKELHRERQADTAKYAADFFNVISPLKKQVDNIKTFNNVPLYFKVISWIVGKIPMINLRKLAKASENADYIYTRGDIPLFPKKPFIIELDNPYILTFYNYFGFKLYKPIIKRFLGSKKCKKIVCISEACKKTFLEEMGQEFEKKTIVLYPRMKDFEPKKEKKDNTIKFIFIGLQARLKGLYEALEAFHSIKNENICFEIIGLQDAGLQEKYSSDKRIQFLGQIPRTEIINTYLPKGDILMFPSFFESFGIVALEALSHGLGIITTNVFALPEVCKDGYNGKIIRHPYFKKNKYGFVDITKVKMSIGEFNIFLEKKGENKAFEKQIYNGIIEGINNYKIRKKHSEELYIKKFNEKKREESFKLIFK